jgi:hypothetical protein
VSDEFGRMLWGTLDRVARDGSFAQPEPAGYPADMGAWEVQITGKGQSLTFAVDSVLAANLLLAGDYPAERDLAGNNDEVPLLGGGRAKLRRAQSMEGFFSP